MVIVVAFRRELPKEQVFVNKSRTLEISKELNSSNISSAAMYRCMYCNFESDLNFTPK